VNRDSLDALEHLRRRDLEQILVDGPIRLAGLRLAVGFLSLISAGITSRRRCSRRFGLFPKPSERRLAQRRIPHRRIDGPMANVALNQTDICALVDEFVTGRVTQHVRMDVQVIQAGSLSDARD
jgi:hypothetical protein